jgi:hypothetical protein
VDLFSFHLDSPIMLLCPADPFPPSTTTLDNPAYRWLGLSLMKGALVRGCLAALAAAESRPRLNVQPATATV